MNLKKMIEQRNKKVDEMGKILEKADKEERALTDEEIQAYDELKKAIEGFDKTIEKAKEYEKENMTEEEKQNKEEEEEETQKQERAFANLIRGEDVTDTNMTKSDNGVVIGNTILNRIIDTVADICPIFQLAERYDVKGSITIPKYTEKNGAIQMEYADEFTSAKSTAGKFESINLGEFLGRALTKISNSLINNSNFDIVTYIVNKVAQAVKKFVEREMLIGTKGKIEGLSGVELSVESSSANKITGDDLIDTQEEVIDDYQNDAIWIMNRDTRKQIRKIKDTEGNYVLNRDLSAKWGYTLLGKDVYTTDAMPKIKDAKENESVIYYGDMTGLALKISEDMSVQILKEKYAEEHVTAVLAFIGLDCKVQDVQKIAKLTMKSATPTTPTGNE